LSDLVRTFTAVVFVFLLSGPVSPQSRCRAADANSQHFLRVIGMMMMPEHSISRTSNHLPLVKSSQITLVTDSTVCSRAGKAMDSLGHARDGITRPPSTIPLFVFQIGTSHAVVDLLSPNDNDADLIYFFGPSWNFSGISFSQ
jgi:hypothetical protein